MDLGLKERVAIVGGSSRGMGRAGALTLAREGAFVTISGRNEADLRKAEIDIAKTSSQHHVLAVPADLTKVEDIKRVVRGTFNRFGRIDIAVINTGGIPTQAAEELEDDEWGEALEHAFLSVVRMTKEVVPYMIQQQWGRIINRLSIPMKLPVRAREVLTSSRMAIVGYSRELSTELAKHNITVNNVLPGTFETEAALAFYREHAKEQGRSAEEVIKETTKAIPMERLGNPNELGDLIAFLASERASYITGASFPVDGGAFQVRL